jgi:class 3 adenylate cyclase/TolB-like protein
MAEERLERKVTVILATDVAGYSKHVEQDESLTIKTFNAREAMLRQLITDFRGRVFNTGGDSVLAEFASAVDAVECAAAFQSRMADINKQPDTKCRLEFRVGINMGDVIQKDDNLLGDGVNIAARLEALSQPNGVCVSKSVYDLVAPKTELAFNDLGIQKVKENSFHAFDLVLSHLEKRTVRRPFKAAQLAIGAALILLFASAAGFYLYDGAAETDASAITTASSSQPTILIYPFENLSDKTDSNSFGAAFTDSLIQSLSQYSGIIVLSGSTSKHAKQNKYTDSQMRENYGATILVKGSIQSVGSNSRLGVRIVDLKQNAVGWSENYQFGESEIFDIQDQIGAEILNYLHINIVTGSQTNEWIKKLGNLKNLTLMLNARNEWRKYNPDGHAAYWNYIKRVEKNIGENSPALYSSKAWGLYQTIGLGLSTDIETDKARMFEYADADIEAYGSAQSYGLRALLELRHGSVGCSKATELARKATQLGGVGDAFTIAGTVERKCGDMNVSIKNFKNALRMTPNDNGFFIRRQLAGSYLLNADYEKIQEMVNPLVNSRDIHPTMLALLAYADLKTGNKRTAKAHFQKAKDLGLKVGNMKPRPGNAVPGG